MYGGVNFEVIVYVHKTWHVNNIESFLCNRPFYGFRRHLGEWQSDPKYYLK